MHYVILNVLLSDQVCLIFILKNFPLITKLHGTYVKDFYPQQYL